MCDMDLPYDDPLGDVKDSSDSNYYRLNRIVFADPLENILENKNFLEGEGDIEELILTDNITVRKNKGKKKMLNVQLKDNNNLNCSMPDCNRQFSSTVHLKAHIRKVHLSTKCFTCEVCGAGFTAQYLLKRHSVVHGDKKTKCPVCQKTLSLRTSLSVHLRSHANTRQHQCVVCKKRFLRNSTLRVHVGAVHGETKLD